MVLNKEFSHGPLGAGMQGDLANVSYLAANETQAYGLDKLTLLFGREVYFPPADAVAKFLRQGWFEFEDIAFTALLMRPGDAFADIGAHAGLYSALVDEVTGHLAHIVAVEANSQLNFLIRKNLGVRSPGDTTDEIVKTVVSAAVGAPAGAKEVKFLVKTGGNEAYSHIVASDATPAQGHFITVPAISLADVIDTLPKSKFTFVKIDIEGSEYEAITQAHDYLSQSTDVTLLVEFTEQNLQEQGRSTSDLAQALISCGFTLCEFDPEKKALRKFSGSFPVWHKNIIATKDVGVVNARLSEAHVKTVNQVDEFVRRGRAARELHQFKAASGNIYTRLSGLLESMVAIHTVLTKEDDVRPPARGLLTNPSEVSLQEMFQALEALDERLGAVMGSASALACEKDTLATENNTVAQEREALFEQLNAVSDQLGRIASLITGSDERIGEIAARFERYVPLLKGPGAWTSFTGFLHDELGRLRGAAAAISQHGDAVRELERLKEDMAASLAKKDAEIAAAQAHNRELWSQFEQTRTESASVLAEHEKLAAAAISRQHELETSFGSLTSAIEQALAELAAKTEASAKAAARHKELQSELERLKEDMAAGLVEKDAEIAAAHARSHELESQLERTRTESASLLAEQEKLAAAAIGRQLELETSIGSLTTTAEQALAARNEASAEAAARHQELLRELERLKEDMAANLAKKDAEIAAAQAHNRELWSQFEQTRTESASVLAEHEKLAAAAISRQHELETSFGSLTSAIDQALAELAAKNEASAEAAARHQELQSELERLKEDMATSLAERDAEIAAAHAHSQELESQLERTRTESASLLAEQEKLAAAAIGRQLELETSFGSLTSVIEQALAELAVKKEASVAAATRHEELQSELERLKEDMTAGLAQKEAEIASAYAHSRELQDQLERMRLDLAGKDAEVESMSNRLAELQSEQDRAKEPPPHEAATEEQMAAVMKSIQRAMEELDKGEQRSAEAALLANKLGDIALDLSKSRWIRFGEKLGVRASAKVKEATQIYLGKS
ncbi:FkbM family methyltransferase [Hyphomicrobium sp.]|uniref:FkbM family methyltransferase n=1 Tax=Hyphomicrobium sp. TaxID=82 RepID=UPI0025C379D9|nr:FkbM family methyltransferase [Hyphomicrobium sp.]MCC7253458.1 FkbM family methyltransferase [Hyphomicrobium sp.]